MSANLGQLHPGRWRAFWPTLTRRSVPGARDVHAGGERSVARSSQVLAAAALAGLLREDMTLSVEVKTAHAEQRWCCRATPCEARGGKR